MTKQYGHNGLAGCVTQRKTRKGRQVGLYHADQAGIDTDPECKWATVCEEHGSLICHPTLATARSWLSHPEEWCDDCREANREALRVEAARREDEMWSNRHKNGARVAHEMWKAVAAGELDESDCTNFQAFWKRKDHDPNKEVTFADFEKGLDTYAVRREYAKRLFCLATKQWMDSIERLVKGKRVVEICAGHGLIATAMQKRGVEWIATDLEPPEIAKHVRKMDAREAVRTLQPDIVFVSWPPMGDTLDKDVADMGIPMIVVGEWAACTGSDEFFEAYSDSPPADKVYEWFEELPSFDGINDFTSLINWSLDER